MSRQSKKNTKKKKNLNNHSYLTPAHHTSESGHSSQHFPDQDKTMILRGHKSFQFDKLCLFNLYAIKTQEKVTVHHIILFWVVSAVQLMLPLARSAGLMKIYTLPYREATISPKVEVFGHCPNSKLSLDNSLTFEYL